MVTNQPTAMIASTMIGVGKDVVSSATATGGSHDRNGPKNGMAWRIPAATAVTPPYWSPNPMLTIVASTPNTTPITSCVRRNPPNERPTLLWTRRAVLVWLGGTSR